MCKDAHSWAQLPSLTWGDLTVEKWSDTIKVQCQNCRKREEERQWNGTMRILELRYWSCRTRSEWRKRVNSLTWTMEGLFSAAEIARLKNTVSLPCGKRHGLYKCVPCTNGKLVRDAEKGKDIPSLIRQNWPWRKSRQSSGDTRLPITTPSV